MRVGRLACCTQTHILNQMLSASDAMQTANVCVRLRSSMLILQLTEADTRLFSLKNSHIVLVADFCARLNYDLHASMPFPSARDLLT